MGGPGSGRWSRWQGKKSTVEDSLVLPIKEFRNRLEPGTAGSFTWRWSRGGKSTIDYSVTGSRESPIVNLEYRWRKVEEISIPVRLTTTPTQFGGRRWWFICPLIVSGTACNRRAGKLYLPPGGKYFGCRKCYDLTYESCQEAHNTERLFARIGFDAEVARMWDRMHRYK